MIRRGLQNPRKNWMHCSLMRPWPMSHSLCWETRLTYHMLHLRMNYAITLVWPTSPPGRGRWTLQTQMSAPLRYLCAALYAKWAMVMGSSGSLNISSRVTFRKMYYSKPAPRSRKRKERKNIIIIPQDDHSQGGTFELNSICFGSVWKRVLNRHCSVKCTCMSKSPSGIVVFYLILPFVS